MNYLKWMMGLSAIVMSLQVNGQELRKHELMIDGTLLLSNIFGNFSSNGIALGYNYRFNEKLALRVLNNTSYDKTVEPDLDESTFIGVESDLQLQRYVQIGKKWEFLPGSSFKYAFDNSNFKSENFNRKNSAHRFGIGGVLGIQFNINERMALYTQGWIGYSKEQREFDETFFGTPNQQTRTRIGFDYDIPASVHFVVKL